MDWVRPPLLAKISKKKPVFMITFFWNRWDPPLLKKKIPKKSQFFLIRKFWIRRDPPPLSEFFRKKTVFFLCLPLYFEFDQTYFWSMFTLLGLASWLAVCYQPLNCVSLEYFYTVLDKLSLFHHLIYNLPVMWYQCCLSLCSLWSSSISHGPLVDNENESDNYDGSWGQQ